MLADKQLLFVYSRAEDGNVNGPTLEIISGGSGGSGVSYANCVVATLTCLVNISLQLAVVFFLRLLRRNRGSSVGILLSMNLCASEIGITLLSLVTILLSTFLHRARITNTIMEYLIALIAMMFTTTLYFIKLFIASVEVLKVRLDLRNNGFWTKKKSNGLMTVAWVIGVSFFSVSIIAREGLGHDLHITYKYVIIPGTLVFVLCGFASNGYLLCKLNRSRIPPHRDTTAAQQPVRGLVSFWKVFLKSQFVVPVLISLVFTLFLVCACVESFPRHQEGSHMNFLTFMLFNGMIFIDGLIYLILEPQLRNLIKNRVRNWRAERDFIVENHRRHLSIRRNTEDIELKEVHVVVSSEREISSDS